MENDYLELEIRYIRKEKVGGIARGMEGKDKIKQNCRQQSPRSWSPGVTFPFEGNLQHNIL